MTIGPLGFRWLVRGTGPERSLRQLQETLGPEASLALPGRPGSLEVIYAYTPRAPESELLRRLCEPQGFVVPPLVLREGCLRIRCIHPRGTQGVSDRSRSTTARLIARRSLTADRLRGELDRLAPGLPALTPRQTQVLLAAMAAGYYEVPRRATVGEIARGLSLGRSTVEEHLRFAESAVVRSSAALVELGQFGGGDSAVEAAPEHFVRYCPELELYIDLALRGQRVARLELRQVPPAASGRDHPILRRILDHVRTGRDDLRDVPVELPTPPFERKVLEELRRIPVGETRSYGEIARRIGHPGASRAVGNACGSNPVPIVIPCHRVVPSHGGLGNYSALGGAETKRRLLAREGAETPGRAPVRRQARRRPSAFEPIS